MNSANRLVAVVMEVADLDRSNTLYGEGFGSTCTLAGVALAPSRDA
jgi:hypothetical protein